MSNEHLLRDDRLANALGRPVRGFPWWMHEVTQQMWLALHTGWQLMAVPSKDQRICNTIARPEHMHNWDLRLIDNLVRAKLEPKVLYSDIKLACITGQFTVR